jgi:ubiquinone/menaquinone biosynthesis C-methylase UbiE
MGAAAEVTVWEAFRSLPLDGEGLYPSLVKHLDETSFWSPPGDTLEIGGGDAELWRQGGRALVERVVERGRLLVTDADAGLVRTCRDVALLKQPGVTIEQADVTALPYEAGRFARVLAVHVLHWCRPEERLSAAVAEIRRVLNRSGRATIVAVDAAVHMKEVYTLLGEARSLVLDAGGAVLGMPAEAPRVQPFCAANAEGYLEKAFARVVRRELAYAHVVPIEHGGQRGENFLVRYVRTLPFIEDGIREGQIPEAFFAAVRERARAFLEAQGALRMSRRDVIYDCTGSL